MKLERYRANSVKPYPYYFQCPQKPQTSLHSVDLAGLQTLTWSQYQPKASDTKGLVGSTDHSDLCGPAKAQPLGTKMALVGGPYPWHLVAIWTIDIYTDPC